MPVVSSQGLEVFDETILILLVLPHQRGVPNAIISCVFQVTVLSGMVWASSVVR